jgi:chorismate synthase
VGAFRFLTAGESHGKGLTIVIEGVPAGLELSEEFIARDLKRRQGGYGRGGRMKIEQDFAEITAGVRHGRTLGSPIALWIQNRDWDNWREPMAIEPVTADIERVTRVRPGHTDLVGSLKYGADDVRNTIERASARETAARVAAGAVARRFLEEFGVIVHSHTLNIGGAEVEEDVEPDWSSVEESPVRCAVPEVAQRMIENIDAAKAEGDTVGGIVEVRADGVPIGLGSHVHWDRKLDGRIAQAVCSINAFKGVDFGSGFRAAGRRGSRVHDVVLPREEWGERRWRHATNRHGGIIGGISTGEPIVLRAVVKPIPTLAHPLQSVDLDTGEGVLARYERSDVCVVPAAGVVAEAMVMLVLAEAVLEKFGGDRLNETVGNWKTFARTLVPRADVP